MQKAFAIGIFDEHQTLGPMVLPPLEAASAVVRTGAGDRKDGSPRGSLRDDANLLAGSDQGG